MKTQQSQKKSGITNLNLVAALAISLVATHAFNAANSFAATQDEANAFESFKDQLDVNSSRGSTYLSFMQNQVKPALDAYKDDINEAQSAGNYRQAILQLLSSGKGVAVRIDRDNYISNVGYLTGENQDDVKSGRSFGVGPTHRQSDPSDVFYLGELESYLGSEKNVEGFYRSLVSTLTDCDTSGWKSLSVDGQTVATDFLAIYTAESDRHIMVQLKPNAHPWENDLAGATFVAIVDVASGKMIKNGEVADGEIKDWWAKGKVGSGIGETRRDRLALQQRISKFERANHAELVSAIEAIVGESRNGDVIQGMLEYLNNPNTKTSLGGQASELTEAFVKFLMQAQSDASDIMAT